MLCAMLSDNWLSKVSFSHLTFPDAMKYALTSDMLLEFLKNKEIQKSSKGQLISKGLLDFFNSSKKRTKKFCPSRVGQKLTFSSSFFGRIVDISRLTDLY